MLNHQNRFAQVKVGSARRAASQIFGDVHEPVRLLPEPDLAVLARIPAVADDAVCVRILAGQVIGLRRAGDGGERRLDARHCALLRPGRQLRHCRTEQLRREPDDAEDDGPVHESAIGRRSGSIRGQHPLVLAADRLQQVDLQPIGQDVPGVGFDLEVRREPRAQRRRRGRAARSPASSPGRRSSA